MFMILLLAIVAAAGWVASSLAEHRPGSSPAGSVRRFRRFLDALAADGASSRSSRRRGSRRRIRGKAYNHGP